VRSLTVFAAICLLSSTLFAQRTITDSSSNTAGSIPSLQHFDPNQVDKSLDPCNDFFEYACGKWMKANPIPPDQAGSGTFAKLAVWNVSALHETLEEASKATNRTPAQQRAGDYYASCMDEATINKKGIAPLKPELDRIANFKEKSDLPDLVASIHQMIQPANLNFIDAQYQGVLFGIYAIPDFDDARTTLAALDQSGMGLPGREFYLNDDAKSKQIRADYLKHVTKMLELSGEPPAQAATDAQAILTIETGLAKAAMDIIARRDPKNQNNKMSLQQVQALTPSFDWSRYFGAMNAPPSPQYIVLAPGFFRGVDKLISSEPVDHWRAYLRFSTLRFMSQFLSEDFVSEQFDFFGKQLAGAQKILPRWRRCSASTDTGLGDASGQAYVAKYFPPENKERMLQMVKAIEAALHQDIDAATWMSPQTKELAHTKLSAQVDKIGYPDHWIDYSTVEIKRDDYLGNAQRAAHFEINRRLAKFGMPAKRDEWGMTPPTVNAYEDAQSNTINFPAGILQPPFFDAGQIDAVNYGAIGAVIGHEITHGFDDQGRKFDADGNLKDWWTPQDAANYDERDKCIQNEYTQEVPEAGVKQNGALSAGEDTADNGGIHLTMSALQSTLKLEGKTLDTSAPDNITELQNFFLAYANVWCGELRPQAARTAVMTQGHSLPRYRVNNVVGNMPEFAHAFGCHAGQPMVHANQCRVW
jgi:endothelin-converting enzyme/putative endopeptidase